MKSPADINFDLINSSAFKEWKRNHLGFLSHFFCALSSDFKLKSNWEVGYYCPRNQKISIFVPSESSFILKQEDDVFKKETTEVEKLDLDKINQSFEEVSETCKLKLPGLFGKELLGDGFVVLQTLEGRPSWNFTFVSKTFKFANLKIDAINGEIRSHQLIEAVTREK
ncbi:MAG TPA: hypothetical protein VJI98_00975 [Candidatus Nanoarchaeia archaeon]|nr:hypothetical protein [Candidatus Nanoarchaeia archaeon]